MLRSKRPYNNYNKILNLVLLTALLSVASSALAQETAQEDLEQDTQEVQTRRPIGGGAPSFNFSQPRTPRGPVTWMFERLRFLGQVHVESMPGLSSTDVLMVRELKSQHITTRLRLMSVPENALRDSEFVHRILATIGLGKILDAHVRASGIDQASKKLDEHEVHRIARSIVERAALAFEKTPDEIGALSDQELYAYLGRCSVVIATDHQARATAQIQGTPVPAADPFAVNCRRQMEHYDWFSAETQVLKKLFPNAQDRVEVAGFFSLGGGGLRPLLSISSLPVQFSDFVNVVKPMVETIPQSVLARLSLASLARKHGLANASMTQHLAWSVQSGLEMYQTLRCLFELYPIELNRDALEMARVHGQLGLTAFGAQSLARAVLPFMPKPPFDPAQGGELTRVDQVLAFDPQFLALVFMGR